MSETAHAAKIGVVPPAAAGMALHEVDTPALVIDLDAFERNLRAMAGRAAAAGVGLRPHAKTHKCVEIARRQIALGAIGVCCQKVSEAEVLVRGGIRDVLVSNEIVGAGKLDRLAALAREARIGVCIDALENVAGLEAAAARAGTRLDALVEIEVGGQRCGVVDTELAVRIARAIDDAPSLRLGGIQAYHGGSQHIAEYRERRDVSRRVEQAARRVVERFEAAGLRCASVTGAGTGTAGFALEGAMFTELQAGSYIFMDADYARIGGERGRPFDDFEHALFVLARVMSRPAPERAVVDAGHKSASIDSGMPGVHGRPAIAYTRPADEHGVLVSHGGRLPALGERVLLVPGHCDPTVNLHDWLVGVRGLHGDDPRVESVWPVDARGAVF